MKSSVSERSTPKVRVCEVGPLKLRVFEVRPQKVRVIERRSVKVRGCEVRALKVCVFLGPPLEAARDQATLPEAAGRRAKLPVASRIRATLPEAARQRTMRPEAAPTEIDFHQTGKVENRLPEIKPRVRRTPEKPTLPTGATIRPGHVATLSPPRRSLVRFPPGSRDARAQSCRRACFRRPPDESIVLCANSKLPKVGEWKGPYHATRACLEILASSPADVRPMTSIDGRQGRPTPKDLRPVSPCGAKRERLTISG